VARINKNILFICLPSTIDVFKKSKISIAVPLIPLVSIAELSAVARKQGWTPYVLDLSVKKTNYVKLRIIKAIREIKPAYCGITFTTPLSKEADQVAEFIKKIDPKAKMIAGGCHPTIMGEETLKSGNFDIVVNGEGEITLQELLSGKDMRKIDGLLYRKGKKIMINKERQPVLDLDDLPLPDYSVFNSKDYRTPRLNCRKNPVVAIETSRGCVGKCVYCNKAVFGNCFRYKSAKRTVDEMVHILSYGYKEIHIWDDGFSNNMQRAKDVCKEIIKRKLKITWNIYNGIRVSHIDKELLELLKKSGCYRISIGVESGNQKILDKIGKGITIKQIKKVFGLANKVGIETIAFCMIGLPGETEETMMQTIDLMLEIKPTIPKLSIVMPLPGTPLFEDWDKKGYIISKDWSNYIFHLPQKVYNHPNLDWQTINKYYDLFYRKTMLSPGFLFRRLVRDIKTGELFIDIYYFLKSLKWGW